MNNLTSYFKDTGIKEGYCRICGEYGILDRDHVPPKALTTPGNSLYCTLFEGHMRQPIKKKKGLSGIYFKTICRECNNEVLGEIDYVYKDLKKQINELYKFINRGGELIQKQKIQCKSSDFLRATIGHMLAIDYQESCKNPLTPSDFFSPLRDFVLGEREDIDTHQIKIWPYKKRKTLIAQTMASTSTIQNLQNGGDIYSSIKIFPFGLTIRLKNKSAGIINFGDEVIPGHDHINFTPWLEPHQNYPEGIFRQDQIILTNNETGIHGTINPK